MYNAIYYMNHYGTNIERLHEIRKRESKVLDPKARNLMEELKKKRPSLKDTVLVSRHMVTLPKPGIY